MKNSSEKITSYNTSKQQDKSQILRYLVKDIAEQLETMQKSMNNALGIQVNCLSIPGSAQDLLSGWLEQIQQVQTKSRQIQVLVNRFFSCGSKKAHTKNIYEIPIELSPMPLESYSQAWQPIVSTYFDYLKTWEQVPFDIKGKISKIYSQSSSLNKLEIPNTVSGSKHKQNTKRSLQIDLNIFNLALNDKKSQISTHESRLFAQNNSNDANIYPTFDDPPSPCLDFSFTQQKSAEKQKISTEEVPVTTPFNSNSCDDSHKMISFNLSSSGGEKDLYASFEGRFMKKTKNAFQWSPASHSLNQQESALLVFTPQSKKSQKLQQQLQKQPQPKTIQNQFKSKLLFEIPTEIYIQTQIEKTKIYEVPTDLQINYNLIDRCSQTLNTSHDVNIQTEQEKQIFQKKQKNSSKCQICSEVWSMMLLAYSGQIKRKKNKLREVIYEVPLQMQMETSKNSAQFLQQITVQEEDDEDLRISDFSKRSGGHSHRLSILPCESINIMNAVYLPPLADLQAVRDRHHKHHEDKKGVHLSASIQSLAFGMTDRKSSKQDNEEKEYALGVALNMPTSSNINSLQHPQLNFCASSTLNDHSQHQQQLRASSFFRNSPESSGGSSLKFKESCIGNKANANKIVQFNNSIVEPFKPEHQIYLIDESSSEDSHTLREMDLSEKQQQTYNKEFRESSVDFADFYELREKKMILEEQNIELNQRIYHLEKQLSVIKKEKQQVQNTYKSKFKQITQRLSSYEDQLGNMEMVVQQKQQINQELNHSNSLKEQELKALTHSLREKDHRINEFIQQKDIETANLEQSREQLSRQNQQKQKWLEEINHEYELMKVNYQVQINELKLINQRLSLQLIDMQKKIEGCMGEIEELSKEGEHKNQMLETFKNEYNDLLEVIEAKNMGSQHALKNNTFITPRDERNRYVLPSQQINYAVIESQQQVFIRGLEQQLKIKDDKIQKLGIDNRRLHKEVIENIEMLEEQRKIRRQQNRILKQLAHQNQNNNNNGHTNLQRNKEHTEWLQEETDRLRKENIGLKQQLAQKQEIVAGLSKSRIKLRDNTGQTRMSIEFIEERDDAKYLAELQNILMLYERVIMENTQTIKDLQQRVFEYLGDAIEKEKQAQKLYDELLQYETDINALVLDKINLENENKRMKKMISASERKISAIGTRLIHAAKDKNHRGNAMDNKHLVDPNMRRRQNPDEYDRSSSISTTTIRMRSN